MSRNQSDRQGSGALRWRWRVALAGTVMTAAVGLLFQNCTQGAKSGDQSDQNVASALTFSYDARFDQVAYLSCNQLQGADPSYFTLRAGAYRYGGISISTTGLAGFSGYQTSDQATILGLSSQNSGMQPQAAFRYTSNYQSLFAANGTPTEGTDYANFFTELGEPQVSTDLIAAAGQFVRYSRTGTVAGAKFEASLNFGVTTGLELSLRQALENNLVLAVTYASQAAAGGASSAGATAVGPADYGPTAAGVSDVNSVYGRGLFIKFQQPSFAGVWNQFPAVALQSVTELNLQDPTQTSENAPWVCPANYQFRIVRLADTINYNAANPANCVAQPDAAVLSGDMQIIRRSLHAEDWYIDQAHSCIVSKRTGPDCYGSSALGSAITSIQYNLATNMTGVTAAQSATQFASICYRTQ